MKDSLMELLEDEPKLLPTPIGILEQEYQYYKNNFSGVLRMQHNEEQNSIAFGDCIITNYIQFKNVKAFAKYILNDNKSIHLSWHPKYFNKCMMELLGYPLSHIYKCYKGLAYKIYVVPYLDLLTKIHFKPGKISTETLQKIVATEPLLRQAQKDGQYNLLPIIMELKMSPQELKKTMGNKWKIIANNSLNKNKFLAGVTKTVWQQHAVEKIKNCAHLPTTVLQHHGHNSLEILEHIAAHYRGVWSKELNSQIIHINDTKRLAEQLDKPFNHLWSPRRMKEEHDKYSKELTARKFSSKPLQILEGVPTKEFEYEGYKATLLKSRALIAEEGQCMNHCVASYTDSVAQSRYLVYSITKDGERSSTLGISIKKGWMNDENKRYYMFNQHYRRFDHPVENEHEKEIGQLIIKELNK